MHGFAFECFYCGKFFARADKQERHIENCSGVPGIIYIFNNKHLITFEDNFKSKGGMAMVMYCDFDCYNPEQKTMFVLSYVLIVAFHPHLNLRKVIVQRSYRYSLEQLTMIDYLANDQMSFIEHPIDWQTNKCVICKMSSKIDPLGYDVPNCLTVIFSLDMNTNF